MNGQYFWSLDSRRGKMVVPTLIGHRNLIQFRLRHLEQMIIGQLDSAKMAMRLIGTGRTSTGVLEGGP